MANRISRRRCCCACSRCIFWRCGSCAKSGKNQGKKMKLHPGDGFQVRFFFRCHSKFLVVRHCGGWGGVQPSPWTGSDRVRPPIRPSHPALAAPEAHQLRQCPHRGHRGDQPGVCFREEPPQPARMQPGPHWWPRFWRSGCCLAYFLSSVGWCLTSICC